MVTIYKLIQCWICEKPIKRGQYWRQLDDGERFHYVHDECSFVVCPVEPREETN